MRVVCECVFLSLFFRFVFQQVERLNAQMMHIQQTFKDISTNVIICKQVFYYLLPADVLYITHYLVSINQMLIIHTPETQSAVVAGQQS